MNPASAVDRIKFLLTQLGLKIQIDQITGDTIQGQIALPDGVLHVVALRVSGLWHLTLGAGASAVGALQTLSPLLGGNSLLASVLPPDILKLTNLTLKDLDAEFNSTLTVLTKVNYSLHSPSPWVIIPNKLSMNQVRSEIVVLAPLGNAKLQLDLNGTIQVGALELPMKARLPQPASGEQFVFPDLVREWPFALSNFTGKLNLGVLLDGLGATAVHQVLQVLPGSLSVLDMPLSVLNLIWDIRQSSLSKVQATLKPEDATLSVDLKPLCSVRFSLSEIEVGYDIGRDAWSLASDAKLLLSGLPTQLDAVFPDELTGHLEIIKVPDLGTYEVIASTNATETLKNIKFGLRDLAMEIAGLELRWPNGNPVLTSELKIETGNAAMVAAILGLPYLPLKDRVRFRLTLDTGQSDQPLRLTLLEWPFTIFHVPVNDGKLSIDLGEFGDVEVELPGLDLTYPIPDEFQGSGKLNVINAAIPLPFLHDLAAAIGLDKFVPERITLVEKGNPVPFQIPDFGVDQNCHPERLNAYKTIKLPSKFDYKINVALNGGLDLGLSPSTSTAIASNKQAAAIFAGVPPLFVSGTQLQTIGWGELYGLQTIQVSAQVDVFAPLLIKALAAVNCNGAIAFLPKSSELKAFWQLGNVRLLLIPPIPIPIFFDPIELDYLGIEGLEIHLKWSFPEPSLFDRVKLIEIIFNFLVKSEPKELDASMLPAPDFSAKPLLSITLPKYLGGAKLEADAEVDGGELMAGLLNHMKNPNPAGIITLLPRKHRMGKAKLELGPINVSLVWAFTSAGEWRVAGAFNNLPDQAVETAMTILGSAPQFNYGVYGENKLSPTRPDDEIVVSSDSTFILLAGKFELGPLANAQVTIGVALVGSGGFATAISVSCELLKGVLRLQLKAVLRVFRADEKLSLLAGGIAEVTLFGRTLFAVSVILTDKSFEFRGKASLPAFLPIAGNFEADGFLDTQGKFEINGKFNAKILGLTVTDTAVALTNQGTDWFTLQCSLLGQNVALRLKSNFSFQGELSLGGSTLKIKVDELKEPNTGIVVWPAINESITLPLETKATMTIGPEAFEVTLSLKLDLGITTLDIPEFTLSWPSVPESLEKLVDAIGKYAEEYLLSRPLGLFAPGGLLNPLTWVAFALDLAQRWAENFSENFKKLVTNTGKELVKLRDNALAAMARWDPSTWDLALAWDPGKWAKAISLPSVAWDLSFDLRWSNAAWKLVPEIPPDLMGPLKKGMNADEFAGFVNSLVDKVPGYTAGPLLETTAKMLGVSDADVDNVKDTLSKLDPKAWDFGDTGIKWPPF